MRQYRTPRKSSSGKLATAVLALTLVIAACGGDSVTAVPTSPPGSYALATVQGKPLPYRLYSETNYSVDVASGSLILKPDGTFLAAMKSEERVENHLSVYADTNTGTWVQAGSKISFTTSDGYKASANWSGRTLTLTDSSATVPVMYVYTMQ